MKKNGSTNANASVAKNTVRKMLNMPFCAYCVQISTTFLLSSTDALVGALEVDVRLDELDRAVGAGGDGLRGRAGEPVDHRAAGDQAEQERRVQDRQVRDELRLEPVREHDDDREDHRRRADDGGADQHRLGGRLERVAGAVVLLEQVLRALEVRREAVLALDAPARCRASARSCDSSYTDCALSVTGP